MARPLTNTERALDRLMRHSKEVLKRMDRGILQASVSGGEMDRLLDKREAYLVTVNAELERIKNCLSAQIRHEASLVDPNRKVHKKRGNRETPVVERQVMRRFPMR